MARRIPHDQTMAIPVLASLLLAQGCGESTVPEGTRVTTTIAEVERHTTLEAAQRYMDQGDIDSAEAILNAFVRKVDDDARAWELFGVIRLMEAAAARGNGDEAVALAMYREALVYYDRALNHDPTNATLHQSAGEIADAAGDLDAALEHYLTAMDADPTNPKPPFFAAQVHLRRDDADAAEPLIRRSLELDPDQAYGHASLAFVAMQQGDTARAIEHMHTARGLDPHDLVLRVQHARLLRESGQVVHGLELLVTLPPEERLLPYVIDELIAGYRELGRDEAIAELWEFVFRRSPRGDPLGEVALRVADAWIDAGDAATAREWIDRAVRLGASSSAVTACRARLVGPAGHGGAMDGNS